MNPLLQKLHPYPFQKLSQLLAICEPEESKKPINLSIGEPKHPAPACINDAILQHLSGLSLYPPTKGSSALREACTQWLYMRYGVQLDPEKHILPVNGSREALFAFTQALINPHARTEAPVVICPNPFYQIYEGAALLAGAQPYYVNCLAENRFQPDWSAVPPAIWEKTQLVFVCSPNNPTGNVMTLEDWQQLFALSDRYQFVIASDECYSEIYFDTAPLGALEAAQRLNRDLKRLIMFTSLSKRSNVPGMRSGFIAGDPDCLSTFLLYRTYHGCAMSPVFQAASIVAWQDEAHVMANRQLYAEKFAQIVPRLAQITPTQMPEAGFYLWLKLPYDDDPSFTKALYEEEHVTVLPGRYLARQAHGINPGAGYVRIALVAEKEDCLEGIERLISFLKRL